jgi:hypothetical protein
MSHYSYISLYQIPELLNVLDNQYQVPKSTKKQLLHNEITKLKEEFSIDSKTQKIDTIKWLKLCKSVAQNQYNIYSQKRDSVYQYLEKSYSKKYLTKLYVDHLNIAIEHFVTQRNKFEKIAYENAKLIQLKDPIYCMPNNKLGRSHFCASQKRIGKYLIDSYYFNLVVIWIFSLLLYISLYFDFFRKIGKYLDILHTFLISDMSAKLHKKRQN